MATYTVSRAAHKTLTGTTVDTVNITSASVEIINRVGTDPLWVTIDGTEPVAGADNIHVVPAGTWKTIRLGNSTDETATIKILGNGNEYSVEETF